MLLLTLSALVLDAGSIQDGYRLQPTDDLKVQDIGVVVEAAMGQSIQGAQWPTVALSSRQTHRLANVTVIAFSSQGFFVPGEPPWYRWIARRVVIDGPRVSIGYADSERCPMIGTVLTLAEQLEPPEIELSGIPIGYLNDPSTQRLNINHDRSGFTLRSTGYYRKTGSRGLMEWNFQRSDGPGAWAEATEASLLPCWTPELQPRVLLD